MSYVESVYGVSDGKQSENKEDRINMEMSVEKGRKQKTSPKRGSKVVGERGFEPPTHWSQTSCATKLRYSPYTAF